jgi:hypothetical protein
MAVLLDTTPVTEPVNTFTASKPEIVDPVPTERPTLVVGDVHGHFDRLEALLLQEGILGECPDCTGFGDLPTGEVNPGDYGYVKCEACDGNGQRRINFDVEVVQIGDLGHFGQDASPTGDMMCYAYAVNHNWFDVVLWGNHDRAVIDSHHMFSGYLPPLPEVKHYMHGLYAMDKLKLAHVAHGWLLTHAGLQAEWKQQKGIDFDRDDPVAFAKWMNANDWWPETDSHEPVRYPPKPDSLSDSERSAMAVRDAISRKRGGWSPTGGILWRDEEEKLYRGMKQVYGHSAQRDNKFVIHQYPDKRMKAKGGIWKGDAFNIDIGSKYGQHLGGVWLPERRLVRVDL